MAGEWLSVTLADVCRDVRYGYTASATEQPTGTKFLRVTDIAAGPVEWESVPFCEISNDDFETYKLEPGDIVIARMGTIGVSALIREPVKAVAASYLIRHRVRESIALPRFIAYVLRSPTYWDFIWSHGGGGAVQPNINAKVLGQFCFRLPSLLEQRAIAHILGTLDDKIELNRRMSETLEAMARALFKAWFVDFEPVRAKMEGRWRRGESLPGFPAHLYDLFPDRLVDSELGEIPEGWGVISLPDAIDFLEGPGLRNWQYREEGMKFLNIRCIVNGDLDIMKANCISLEEFEKIYRHFALQEDDIVISSSGTLGRLAIVRADHLPVMLNTSIIRMRGRGAVGLGYVWGFLQSKYFLAEMFALAAGSVQLNFGPMHLCQISILRPPDGILEGFERTVQPLLRKSVQLRTESRTLAALRDALLPKLISGELRVRDAERFLEERGL